MRGPSGKRRMAFLALLCLAAVLLSGCGDKTKAYDKALAVFASGDYAEAAAAFTKLGDYLQAETYAAYAQGLTYYEQGSYTAAEPYFRQTRDFMYGDQRYRFCHACVLEAAEQFEEAAAWFEALGEFEDAARRAAYCKARVAMLSGDYEAAIVHFNEADEYQDAAERLDQLNFEIFEQASALMDNKEYKQAYTLFTILGDNYDAPSYARACKNYILDQTYNEADAMETAGNLQGAYDAFLGLGGYRDAGGRALDLAAKLGIETPAE